jgi:metal-sulfur cluster biosynthetic enzyme
MADVEEAMQDVVDPELGINVVDLGLVYGIHVDEENVATLDMTLTSAACPLTDVIEDQTRQALCTGPGGGLVQDFRINWGVAAPVGPRQDH